MVHKLRFELAVSLTRSDATDQRDAVRKINIFTKTHAVYTKIFAHSTRNSWLAEAAVSVRGVLQIENGNLLASGETAGRLVLPDSAS